MQPYIFPYIGYFQLISAVDKFVIYDDVNYINKGWINRNNILVNGASYLFTIPLKEVSQNRLINDIELGDDQSWKKKLLRTVEQSYKRAPQYKDVFSLIEDVLNKTLSHIGQLAAASLRSVADYLDLSTEFVSSSTVYDNKTLKGQERILDICLKEKCDHYINPIGGRDIYSKELFEGAGVRLNFIQSKAQSYRQFDQNFVPYLSIIDVLMFNEKDIVKEMLNTYELI